MSGTSSADWQQPFAAGQTRTLVVDYQPVPGTGDWTAETAAGLKQRYCVPPAVAKEFDQRATNGDPVHLRWVHYLTGLGAGSRGTVGHHRVAISPAGKLAFTCRSGLAGDAPAAARETTLSDHVADDEIQVLFVE